MDLELFCNKFIGPQDGNTGLNRSFTVTVIMILQTATSVTKSVVFPWNWTTFILLPWAVEAKSTAPQYKILSEAELPGTRF